MLGRRIFGECANSGEYMDFFHLENPLKTSTLVLFLFFQSSLSTKGCDNSKYMTQN
jgi:hypothetical protein